MRRWCTARGLKTHAKLLLLPRGARAAKLRRYAHLSTGNYNPKTARLYTDLGCPDGRPRHHGRRGLGVRQPGRAGKFRQPRLLLVAPLQHAQPYVLEHLTGAAASRGEPARVVTGDHQRADRCAAIDLVLVRRPGQRHGRPDRARRQMHAAGPAEPEGNGPVRSVVGRFPGAFAGLLPLGAWERNDEVWPVQRRLDGPQYVPPHRGGLARAGRQAAPARDRRGPGAPSA